MDTPLTATNQVAETHRVLKVPELVESILLYAPPETVQTKCRAVCRTWKAVIETSPALIYYTRTGLHKPDNAGASGHESIPAIVPIDDIPSPDKTGIFTPMGIQVLTAFWRRLLPSILDEVDFRDKPAIASDGERRVDLLHRNESMIESLFSGITERTTLLRPGFKFQQVTVIPTGWEFAESTDHVEQSLTEALPLSDPDRPLENILHHLASTVALYARPDREKGARTPLRAYDNVRKYLLFEVSYTAANRDIEAVEARRKHQEWYAERKIAQGIARWMDERRQAAGRLHHDFVWQMDYAEFAFFYQLPPLERQYEEMEAHPLIVPEGAEDPMGDDFEEPFVEYLCFEADEPYDVNVPLRPRSWGMLTQRYREDGRGPR
ncbi:hypothetical protein TWF696_005805 [Orbilia brochopaga]|uniref:F-box domain-containing protein n=1 Tax=Orbilia brochopaga TaxID=3140254 RepID=A0AAV9UUE6_9PEZI